MAEAGKKSGRGAFKGQVWYWLSGVAVLFILGLFLAIKLANRDRDNAMELLEQELALTASSRAQAASGWLGSQRAIIERLASNPAVAIYSMSSREAVIGAGQAEYLARLLETVAAQTNFARQTPRLRANVEMPPSPGLAILDPQGRIIASYGGPLPDPRSFLARARQETHINFAAKLADKPALAILAPVPDPQGGAPVAYVYGVRALDGIRESLVPVSSRFSSARSALIMDGVILVGDPDRLPPPTRLSEMVAQPGQLHEHGNALVVVQPVPATPWQLIRAIDASEGLASINEQWRLRLLGLLALVAFVTALVLLTWRHGASVRAAQSAAVARETAEREAALRAFLQTIADRQPTLIGVVDAAGRLRFSNARLRDWLGADADVHGIALAKLLGPAEPAIAELIARTQEKGAAEALVDLRDPNGADLRHQVEAVALPDGTILLVAHDITELLAERARREANMAALVAALTGLIDARDPGSRHHSEKVSGIAAVLAAELGHTDREIETLRLAGQLMNLGKIMVPRVILTKAGPLTEEERAVVRDALAQSSAILQSVPFEGPVAETVAGVEETSPPPLSRVLRLANAFVSMVSPRSFRAPMTPDEALAQLRERSDPEDHAAISALAHVLDNRGGREILGL